MPTYTYDERVKVTQAMEAAGAAACPRCGSPVEMHRLQTTQDKVLKRPGKPLYRCGNRACACECTPISYLTVAPPPKPPAGAGPATAANSGGKS